MKRFSGYLGAALAVLFMAISVLPASAATPQSSTGTSAGLSITPRKNYTINPGETVTDKLVIGNLDHVDDLHLTLRMIDFTYTNQSGTPKLNLAQNAERTPWSLRSFTNLPKAVDIAAGETKTINYTITIPKDQGAGSYYSAILYQAGGASGGNVALNASGVTLAFVSVPGKVNENMALQKFGAYNSEDNGNTGSYVYIDVQEQPKMVAFTLKNSGNVFESPAGQIQVKDLFGHQVANIKVNNNQSLALLGQARLFTSCIKTVQQTVKALGGASKDVTCVNPKLRPGLYTANLDVFYGQNGNQTHEITATAHFWYLPFWFLLLVAIIIALITYGVFWAKKRIKAAVKGTTYKQGKGVRRR
ncbi:MAG TPA: hypothetical protein VLF59_03860 [Candidatus Saccharimonadales bacterium]|nr:hypothetical protein [Candidatus Saccharimonadales bacterium]